MSNKDYFSIFMDFRESLTLAMLQSGLNILCNTFARPKKGKSSFRAAGEGHCPQIVRYRDRHSSGKRGSGTHIQMCESFHSRKAKIAPKNCAWKSSWLARAVLDANLPGWQLKSYGHHHPDSVQIIGCHKRKVVQCIAGHSIPWERRRDRISRVLARK
jgi:hypothetical protein